MDPKKEILIFKSTGVTSSPILKGRGRSRGRRQAAFETGNSREGISKVQGSWREQD